MNALRPDEDLDNLHSIYVDQWDWEKVITPEQRTMAYLQQTVRRIYEAVKVTENKLYVEFPQITPILPDEIFFISSEELLQRFPNLTPQQREYAICKEYGAVFIHGIGAALSDGKRHDSRAADYDDWALNGDILVWYPLLNKPIELSSMGIRVDAESLHRQLAIAGHSDWEKLEYHSLVLNDSLPLTIGGGIGQSRLCMVLLHKRHIGEVQVSEWPAEQREQCEKQGIKLLK